MGPFIDSDHPDIKKGTADQSFHDIFHFEILRKVGVAMTSCLQVVKYIAKYYLFVSYLCTASRFYPVFGAQRSCNPYSICA
jgi:hypothetical protein